MTDLVGMHNSSLRLEYSSQPSTRQPSDGSLAVDDSLELDKEDEEFHRRLAETPSRKFNFFKRREKRSSTSLSVLDRVQPELNEEHGFTHHRVLDEPNSAWPQETVYKPTPSQTKVMDEIVESQPTLVSKFEVGDMQTHKVLDEPDSAWPQDMAYRPASVMIMKEISEVNDEPEDSVATNWQRTLVQPISMADVRTQSAIERKTSISESRGGRLHDSVGIFGKTLERERKESSQKETEEKAITGTTARQIEILAEKAKHYQNALRHGSLSDNLKKISGDGVFHVKERRPDGIHVHVHVYPTKKRATDSLSRKSKELIDVMQHYCDQLHMLMSLQTPEQWNNIFANKLGHEEDSIKLQSDVCIPKAVADSYAQKLNQRALESPRRKSRRSSDSSMMHLPHSILWPIVQTEKVDIYEKGHPIEESLEFLKRCFPLTYSMNPLHRFLYIHLYNERCLQLKTELDAEYNPWRVLWHFLVDPVLDFLQTRFSGTPPVMVAIPQYQRQMEHFQVVDL